MQQFLVDANVFVAAIKSPGKKTRTLDLIIELISNQGIHLVGNDLLLLEFDKYAEKFKSETAAYLLKRLKNKMRIVELEGNYIKTCSNVNTFRKMKLLISFMRLHVFRKNR